MTTMFFKRFSENKYVLVQISASTGRGDFNNSTNVTHAQIHDDISYALLLGVIRKMKYIGHVEN